MAQYRTYHRIAALISIILFGLMIWDDLVNLSAWFVPLVVLFALHLIIQFIIILLGRERTPEPQPEPAPEPEPVADIPYVYNGYTLYGTETTDRSGGKRIFYFFSKRTPKRGSLMARPANHHVCISARTGLPVLKGGPGVDGTIVGTPATTKTLQCHATTNAGAQCRKNARKGSDYCQAHFGYRPTTEDKAGNVKDTRPASRRAEDTTPRTRRSRTPS